jgi:hypothetical protein
MKPFTTRLQSILDYSLAVFMITMPWLFGFANGGPAQWVPVTLGSCTILVSLITRYEGGAFKLVPMPVHLGLDAANGLVLAASPWLFGFSNTVHYPHLGTGTLAMLLVLLSGARPASVNSKRKR